MTRAALFILAITFAGCGDNLVTPEPDAGVVAYPPTEPPPPACLPWPCGTVDATDAGFVVTADIRDGGASVPPWHLDAGLDAP